MRNVTCLTIMMVLGLFLSAGAQTLDGKKIHIKAGEVKRLNVPLTLKSDVESADDVIKVLEAKTGKLFPATLRNGELVFISEGAMPNTEHEYTVKVEKKTPEYAPHVLITKQEGKAILNVLADDKLFTSYHYGAEWKKPFLWPVNSEGDVPLTRDFPMKQDGPLSSPKDHPHQKSMWTAYGAVNGVDCWAEGEGSGFQVSGEPTFGSGDAYGWIAVTNVWQDKDHKPVITESREYRFYAMPEKGRMIDVFVTFNADYGDVTFKDTKEGGIVSVRMRQDMCENYKAHPGVITNAFGETGMAKCWGKPSPWIDYSGELKEVGWRGISFFDNPANLRYPTSWHVRDYGLMGANCFGWSEFTKMDYNKPLLPGNNGDYSFKSGEKLAFKYRVYVHSGDATAAAVADRYADYNTPPQVEWVK